MVRDLETLSAEEWTRVKPLVTSLARLPALERGGALAAMLPDDGALQAKLLAFLDVIDRASAPFDPLLPPAPGAPSIHDAHPGLEPGRAVGPYQVLERLGAGGMGQVFLAEDTRLGRRVALKEVVAEMPGTARAQVLREARAAARLRHPGIATVHDVFDAPDGLFLVMEYVDGRSLSDLVAAGPLPADDALRLTAQIADAVAYAHDHGVVHCDIKPANVQLDVSGQPKILDFGLAHLQRDDAADDRRAGPLFGTPAYLAPERLVKGTAAPSCDVYSLGVLLFELLTGRLPFHHEDAAQLFFDVLTSPPPTPSSVAPLVPGVVDRVVTRALAKNPAARFQSARELAAALRQALASVEALDVDRAGTPRASAAGTVESRTRRRAIARLRLRTAVLAASLALVFLTFVGFVTSQAYNTAFGRAGQFIDAAPWSWPLAGAQAMVAPANFLVLVLVVGGIAGSVLRTLAPRAYDTLKDRMDAQLERAGPKLAEAVLLASSAALLLFLWRFAPLITAVSGLAYGAAPLDDLLPLGPSNIREHVLYRVWSTLLLLAAAGSWAFVLRRSLRHLVPARVTTRAAGGAVLVSIAFLWAMPHKVLFQSEHPRVVLGEQRCYIIDSHDRDRLLFCPLAEPSLRTRVVDERELTRSGPEVVENVFSALDRRAGS